MGQSCVHPAGPRQQQQPPLTQMAAPVRALQHLLTEIWPPPLLNPGQHSSLLHLCADGVNAAAHALLTPLLDQQAGLAAASGFWVAALH